MTLALPASAVAQSSRDEAYDSLLRQSRALATIEPTSRENRDFMRATAVILAERLKRFTITETEARDDTKVPAPPGAALRPGEGEGEGERAPGDREALSDVPNVWFARYATQARGQLSGLIADLDAGTTPAADLMLRADSINLILKDLARPPE
jgi:hypothetical protein